MDYYEIGKRIRKYRKACGYSQEQLAERIGISTTHMSHIETGNTKLSLQVFVDLAEALSVHTDELLYDFEDQTYFPSDEITEILSNCNKVELAVMTEIMHTVKNSLRKYL